MITSPDLGRADALNLPIANNTIDCVVTSPPYWGLRHYEIDNQLGMESTPKQYCNNMVKVFREIRRVLKPTGTVWLNLGDTYVGTGSKGDYIDPKNPVGRNGQVVALNNKVEGLKSKDLIGLPWKVAFALQADGWWLRSDIIWNKPNQMPDPVKDRPTKSHEYMFLLTKSGTYYYDYEAIKERTENGNTRNKRTVWQINTQPYGDSHFATYPEKLVEPCILAGCPKGGIVLDPFVGSGTTMVVAQKHGRKGFGIDANRKYLDLATKRIQQSEYNNQYTMF